MKRLPILLGVALSLLAPLSAQANPNPQKTVPGGKTQNRAAVANATAQDSRRVYYISNIHVTGSNIPLVFYRHQGRWYPLNGPARLSTYGQESLRATGYNDVGAALRMTDPSIH